MPALKIGIELATLRLPFQEALATAARLGADAVEIDARGEINPRDTSRTAVRQIRKMLEDHRLRVSALSFRTHRGYNTTADLEPRVAATKEALELAHALGAPVVVNSIGRVPDPSDAGPWNLLVQVLDELGRHGSRVGAVLAAETGAASGDDLARLLAALPAGALGIDFDPGNLVLAGFSPLDAVRSLGPSILHVHATDAACDLGGGRGARVALGAGAADFPALLGALDEHGYRGDFTIMHPGAADPVRQISQAIDYLRRM